MKVGTIKETKVEEYRVGLTPAGARSLVDAGHEVLVQTGAGRGSGFGDDEYAAAGASLFDEATAVAGGVDLLVKVKEPLPAEYRLLRPGLILFTYLHLAPLPELTRALMDCGVGSIAYETVTGRDGSLPLLFPMSQVAGRMAAEVGAQLLKKPGPGRGKLLGGITGVAPGRAVVLGTGTVATSAASVLVGLEASVTVLGRNPQHLARLEELFPGRVRTRVLNAAVLAEELAGADLLISGVLVPGGVAPKLVSREVLRSMGEGAAFVDVSIDQGGVAETSRPTTHAEPTYVEEGVVHYCVANMPGAVPRTSTEALTSSTLPYVLRLAERGLGALSDDAGLAAGASTIGGKLVCQAVAEAQGLPFTPLEEALAGR
jgi:alanine dehydrogenase